MKPTWRIDLRRKPADTATQWVAQTRVRTAAQAELQKAMYEARGFEVRVVKEEQ